MQLIVLVIFVISIVLCVLIGVKAFISVGCSGIYILGDVDICTGSMIMMRSFVETFWTDPAILLEEMCGQKKLMTCRLINQELGNSTINTVLCSTVSAVL